MSDGHAEPRKENYRYGIRFEGYDYSTLETRILALLQKRANTMTEFDDHEDAFIFKSLEEFAEICLNLEGYIPSEHISDDWESEIKSVVHNILKMRTEGFIRLVTVDEGIKIIPNLPRLSATWVAMHKQFATNNHAFDALHDELIEANNRY